MKSVDAHLRDVLARVGPLQQLELRLLDAHGCMLAENVVAEGPVPSFDNSSMDGYAVRSADVAAASSGNPAKLHVVADIPAGTAPTVSVQPGMCARIMTGAVVPPGADAVVPVEWTDGGLAHVAVSRPVPAGAYVRRVGEDVTPGQVVLESGALLGAAQLGLLAAVGRRTVLVHPRPRVVVLSTGSELVDPGETAAPGQIADANSYALCAAVREAGGIPYHGGIVPDDPRQLTDALEDHLIQADVVVTSGGVSVGAYDVVKDVLSRLGTVSFDRVAMQPGMPQAFGTIGPDQTPIFGLPGNPVSALVSFEVFVRPALRRMLGAEQIGRPQVSAVITQPLVSPEGRRQFVRVRVERSADRWVATPTGGSGSHLLAGLAAANGLAIVPEADVDVAAGTPLLTWLLERRGR